MPQFNCSTELHDGETTLAAWFVRAAHKQAVTGDLIPYANGRACAVCDEHLADGVRFVTETDGITQAIVRRENAETTTTARSML